MLLSTSEREMGRDGERDGERGEMMVWERGKASTSTWRYVFHQNLKTNYKDELYILH